MSSVWIISQDASTPATGSLLRHHHFSRELAARGHRVRLIAGSWHHLLRDAEASETAPAVEHIDGYEFVRIPMPRYAHAHDPRRALNWLLFAWRIVAKHRRWPEPPDVILCSSPAPVAFLGAERLARQFGARLVFEVRDIWPLTLVAVGGHSPRHPMIRFLQWIEDRAYRQSDRVISCLPGAADHMMSRGMELRKFVWIPNGFSKADVMTPITLSSNIENQLPKGKFLVGYTGTFGLVNALDNLLAAAEHLRHHEDIAFAIVGHGRDEARLRSIIHSRGLKNVQILGAIPKGMVQSALKKFDVCYIGWPDSPLYKHGVSANKIFDYLYSERPIIHSYSGDHDPVERFGAGLRVPAEDSSALADAILKLRDLQPEERRRMGENGRRGALQQHEFGILARQLEEVLVGL